MADAPEKDAGPSTHPTKSTKKVSFSGKAVEVGTGARDAPKWKKKLEALFHLDHLQEEASNHVSTAMVAFVQRTSIVKEVCTPGSPRAPWQFRIDDPLWSSKRDYCKFLHSIAPKRYRIMQCSVEDLKFSLSSPRALWRISIRHNALKKTKNQYK
jgi:hypothetical protein